MNRKSFLIFATVIVVLSAAVAAYANSILFVSPTRIELDKVTKVEVVHVTNQSDLTRAYNLVVDDLKLTPEGVTTPAEENFKYSLKKYLRFMPRRVVLQPGESQTIRVMIRPDAQMEEGAYHSHLKFAEDIKVMNESPSNNPKKQGASISARMSYSAAIPVSYDHGNVQVKYGMENAKFAKNKNGNYIIKFDATRAGNGQGRVFVRVFYKAPDAKEEVQLGNFIAQALYREVDVIHHESEVEVPKEVNINPAGKISVRMYDGTDSKANLIKEVEIPAKI